MDIVFSIAFICFLILCSAYFSGSEIALFSLTPQKLKAYKADLESRKRLIARLLEKPSDLLVTIFMLNTIVNIVLQNVFSDLFHAAGWTLKVGLPLVITLILGEIIPKYVGLQNNEKVSYLAAPSVNLWQTVMAPIRRATVTVTMPISRMMFFFLRKEKSIGYDEIDHILTVSEEHGTLPGEEAQLALGYLSLEQSQVKELMQPKEDIVFFNIKEPLSKLIYMFVDQEFSRLPVYEDDVDNILGIIDVRQYFLVRHQIKNSENLRPFLRKPFYIPETTPALVLLKRLDEMQEVLALAVDEYGSINGLITKEDLVENVIGPINVQKDQKKLYTKAGENEIIASGKLELSDFNDLFDVDFQSPNEMVTIGGWLTEKLGEIPKSGIKLKLEGFLFHVLAAEPNRIRRVYIRQLNPKEGPHE